MYMPTLARFTALDPLPPDGEPVLLGASRYAYVNNNPTNFVDPSGLTPVGQACCFLCYGPIAKGGEGSVKKAGIADRDDAGGGNAFLHCLISCNVHSICPICDNNWDNRETESGPPNIGNRQDLRNNAAGRTVAGNCWDGCVKLWKDGKLTCQSKGALVACPPPPKDYPHPTSPPPDIDTGWR